VVTSSAPSWKAAPEPRRQHAGCRRTQTAQEDDEGLTAAHNCGREQPQIDVQCIIIPCAAYLAYAREAGQEVAIIPSVLRTDRHTLRIVRVTHRRKPVRERCGIAPLLRLLARIVLGIDVVDASRGRCCAIGIRRRTPEVKGG
jgi:hypothetical protein